MYIISDAPEKRRLFAAQLLPELTAKDRVKNQQTLALANTIKAQRIVELQNGAHGFTDKKMRTLCGSSIIFAPRLTATGQRAAGCMRRASSSTNHLVGYAGEKITFMQVNRPFLPGFINYLDKVTVRGNKPLSGASKALYSSVLYFLFRTLSLKYM